MVRINYVNFYRHAWNADAVYAVCPSVRPSVKRMDCDKTEERSVEIFIPHGRSFSLVF